MWHSKKRGGSVERRKWPGRTMPRVRGKVKPNDCWGWNIPAGSSGESSKGSAMAAQTLLSRRGRDNREHLKKKRGEEENHNFVRWKCSHATLVISPIVGANDIGGGDWRGLERGKKQG